MISILQGCLGKQEFSESQESLLSRHGEPREKTDIYEARPPSYVRRFFGVGASCPRNIPFPEIRKAPKDVLVPNVEGQVQAYFNVLYGCTPAQYRPSMARRFYMGFQLGASRSNCFYAFPRLMKVEPSVACRVMRQALTPPFCDELDEEHTLHSVQGMILPALRQLAVSRPRLSDQAMRDLIEGMGSIERLFPHNTALRKEISQLKAGLLG